MSVWFKIGSEAPWSLVWHALLVFSAAWLTTAWMLRHARILDVPNARSSHSQPTPRGGGLGIVIGLCLGMALMYLAGDEALRQELSQSSIRGLVCALLLIAAVSFFDDLRSLGVASKMLVHVLATLLALFAGLLPGQDALSGVPLYCAGLAALIWLLGLTNAYNFMDGLDAMAGATALVVASLFALLCGLQGHVLLMWLALTLAAASSGFLCFNWPPARIFMGDIGSTFLGFGFASLGLLYVQAAPAEPLLALLVMPLLLLHYLFDTVFTFCRRLLRGERVTQAHRSHLYQLLNRCGYSHQKVSLLYAGMAFLQGASLIGWHQLDGRPGSLLLLSGILLLAQVGYARWVIIRARQAGLL